MDIFKLIYEHDIVYDRDSRSEEESTLEQFMKPTPTYTKYYLTGTRMGDELQFGLSALENFELILQSVDAIFQDSAYSDLNGNISGPLSARLRDANQHEIFLIGADASKYDSDSMKIDDRTGVGEKLGAIVPVLDDGIKVLFTEKAHHGIDLHLFSRDNVYETFFNTFKPMTSREDFRYFSINGKRVGSERTFYFETWTLDRPPHGFEEVTPHTVLR